MNKAQYFLKRLLDYAFALLLILILIPLFLTLSFILFITNRGQIFFQQKRPGKNEKIFTIQKFCTMNNNTDKSGDLLEDEYRLTPIGKMIRRLSLDELPQLFNIIKGEMSFIGPRPLLIEYLELYNDHQKRRHDVLPGITGWAQVNGRNLISWEEKFEKDIYYVENWSILLDLKIIFMTIQKVVCREGINSKQSATTEKFKGK